ncbi:hypothetical protein [Rhodoferax sp.]|uniref:hypothetical protein n=1 Tax=Rhodoferax sp. TaxID=50421 RepID=UPI00260E5CF1|nr:hypothetical protein [Rhodoferax sp.]MDD2918152.1 hypothetical protein [Rhodoferax sp.]
MLKNIDRAWPTTNRRLAALKIHLQSLARSLAVLATGSVLAAQALTLGELQGDAWIGMPLDVRIAFQADQNEAISAECVRADIRYAEALQNAPHITFQARTLRLQLPDVVTEPVVAIQVRSTCGASQMRRYVLLADLPPGISAPLVPLNTLPAAGARSAVPKAAGASGTAASPQRTAAGTSASKASASKPKAETKSKSKKTAKTRNKKKTKAKVTRAAQKTITQPATSMLKLDPLEILSDRMDTLDTTMLFAPTEDALLQSRQIASLQADLKAMQEIAAKNDRSLLELRGKLQQAKGQQLPITLVYGLMALVLLCLAGLAWLWQRQGKLASSKNDWWQHPSNDELAAALFQPSNAAPASDDSSTAAAPRRVKPAPSQPLDLDFTLPKDSP